MTDFERIKILTGERDEELVEVVLEDATDWVLAYTGRKKMIPELKKTVRDLAVIAINRMGTEGESSRTGAGESYNFDNAPKRIYDVLNRYRLARVGVWPMRLKRNRLREFKHFQVVQKKMQRVEHIQNMLHLLVFGRKCGQPVEKYRQKCMAAGFHLSET